jgi:hypothetical protein
MKGISMNRQSLFLLFLLQLCGSIAFAQMPSLSPLLGTKPLSQPADKDKFTFIMAGDNRPAKASCKQPPVVKQIFSEIHEKNPAFVLWTGDTISGKNPDASILQKQYAQFLEIAVSAGVPVFNAPGNHEMDDHDEVPSSDMKKFYRQYMGTETYGAFNYGDSRFIALDSENEPTPAKLKKQSTTAEGATKNSPPGFITEKQLNLLKADLEANTDKKHVIVFMHHPPKPYGGKSGLFAPNANKLEKIFKKFTNVSYVVSGHEHMYYNPQGGKKNPFADPPARKDPSGPPYYLISGGAGAPLKQNGGGFNHYIVFQVDGDTITPTLVRVLTPLDPQKKDDCSGK